MALQVKPALDSYLRRGKIQRASGHALVRVARVIPVAMADSWGSDGLDFDTDVTPLMHAAEKGDLGSVRRLLSEGADVNAKDWMGRTALLHACESGRISPQVIIVLLAAGADPNALDKGGVTALIGAATGLGGKDNSLVILRNLLAAGARTNAKVESRSAFLLSFCF